MEIHELINKYEKRLQKENPARIEQLYFEFRRDLMELEQTKVEVPEFVAAWIEQCKEKGKSLLKSLLYTPGEVNSWVDNSENQELFANAWIFGYKIEKQKRYLVKVKGVNGYGCYLNKGLLSKEYFFESKNEIGGCRTKHTRKELEKDGFGWVFDCTGIEVLEVEE